MRILHFVSGLDAASGGPSRSVPNQCVATVNDTFSVDLAFIATKNPLPPEALALPGGRVLLHGMSTLGAMVGLSRLIRDCDVLHVNGIWSPSCYFAAHVARRIGCPYVVTPHGMLEPWALSFRRYKKQFGLFAGFRSMINHARVVQATAESEARNLHNLGFTPPIAVIPNSIAIPTYGESIAGCHSPKRVLFVSRIHPKKGALELIRAVKCNEATIRSESWRITLAGPDSDNHWSHVERLAGELGVSDCIEYVGEVDGQAKWDLYRSADLFVLPTFSENFGLVVAEALGCGVPCITTHGAPWSELVENDCGWWHPVGQENLDVALAEALRTPAEQLQAMGQRGMELIRRRYVTSAHSSDFHAMYRWVLSGGEMPSCFLRI